LLIKGVRGQIGPIGPADGAELIQAYLAENFRIPRGSNTGPNKRLERSISVRTPSSNSINK
jgi:hypothetical protein